MNESRITPELVERVSEITALGIPLRLALAKERLSVPEYEEELNRNPELKAIEDEAKCKFLHHAISQLLKLEDPSANIRWLIEKFYPDVIVQQPQNVPAKLPTVAGISDEELKILREEALKL